MKKFSLLLLALICSVATTWAQVEIAVDRSGWSITACNETPDGYEGTGSGSASAAIDNSTTTYYHSDWTSSYDGSSAHKGKDGIQAFLIDMSKDIDITKFSYSGRPNSSSGHTYTCRVYVYKDGSLPTDVSDLASLTLDEKNANLASTNTNLGTAAFNNSDDAWSYSANTDVKTGAFSIKQNGRYVLFVQDTGSDSWLTCADFNIYTIQESVDYTVSGGDVVYDGTTYADGETITLTTTLDESKLSAVAKEGYDGFATVSGTTITVNYYKQYAKAGQAYVMQNVNAKAYVNTETLVSNNVSLQAEGTQLYFTHNNDGSWYINTASDNTGNYIVTDGWWNCRTSSSACAWTIEEGDTEGQYYFKCSTGYLDCETAAAGVALWTDHAKTRANVLFTIEKYDITIFETSLSNAIASAKAQIGTNPGYYKEADVTALTDAAEDALEDESRTIASLKAAQTTLSEGMAALTPIMPVEGKTYQIVSALPGFETQQSVKKAMYDNNGTLSWKTLDSNDRTMYWTLAPVTGGYAMVNVSTGNYAGVQATQSSAYPTTSDATVATLTSLGSAQFNIITTGSGYAMHTGGHSSGAGVSGNVVAWNGSANTGSAWYIVEAEAPSKATITYVTEDGKFNKSYEAAIGGAYPTPEANYMIVFSGVPTGTVTKDETVTLTYTTRYDIATSAETVAKWYAIDIHGNQGNYPLYSDGEYVRNPYNNAAGVDASVYQNGSANSPYAWAFVGDAFTGIKLYNRDSKSYAVQTNDADEKITMGDEGTVFQICATTSGLANSFALKAEGRNYYFNHRNDYVQGWTDADGGSSLRAFEITPIDKVDAKMYIRQDLGCATFVAPFDVTLEDEDNVKAYTTEDAGTWVKLNEITDGKIPAATPVVVYGAADKDYELTISDYPTSTETAPEDGVLVGNLGTDKVAVPAGKYVLQYQEGEGLGTGWYVVATGTTINCGVNRCYMNGLSGGARAFVPMATGETTGISSIATEAKTKADGKYLVNGKIVVVKAGKAYNMNGQIVK